ncbi:MAG: Holliday junction branch migration protein RuvA [Eubacteriales bacterium]|nr:Holliday junction branch migration protein RuvA [Eubacteriales bacterium]
MYAYIKGELAENNLDTAVVEAGGVGYLLTCPTSTLARLGEPGASVKLYTYFKVSEEAMNLYGFYTKAERDMFIRLLSVSGIGPKAGISILSTLSVTDLAIALVTDDIKSLSAVPGIGKKTAQRLILELKEKVGSDDVVRADGEKQPVRLDPFASAPEQEALQALIALGIRQTEAARAVAAVNDGTSTAQQLITKALRALDGKR